MAIARRLVKIAAIFAAGLWLRTGRAGSAPILLELNVDPAILDERKLSEAIQRELASPIVSSRQADHSGEISIRSIQGLRVSVTYSAKRDSEPPLIRTVPLPRNPEERTQWIAWLVGNLARDEAADWLAQHRTSKANQDSAPSENPTATASTVEVPSESEQPRVLQPAIASGLQASPPAALGVAQTRETAVPLEHRLFNVSLWYKWLQLHPESASMRFALHVGAGYGRVGAVQGFGFDLLHHRVEHQIQGVAGSLIWTRAPATRGLAWSSGVVTATGPLRGADVAWIFAYRKEATTPAMLPNPTGERALHANVIGAQLGGIGVSNRGSFLGIQAASIFTTQHNTLRGVQLSLATNIAEQLQGAQMAAVNVASDVSGVQFGLVNYARRVDGIAIGLVNIASNVRVQALPWVERDYHANLGVRYLYQPLTFGYSISHDGSKHRTRVLFGVGARLRRNRVAIAPSVNIGFFADKPSADTVADKGHENDVRVSFEWEPVPNLLGMMAGPALAMQSDPAANWRFIPRWFAGLNLF